LVRTGGTIVIPASQGGDLAQYVESLKRIRALKARRLYPAHGPVIDDPTSVIDEYLRHRARREMQILEALRGGATTADAIVGRVYGTLPPAFAAAAADTVLAHLMKLRTEGKAEAVAIPWEGEAEQRAESAWAWHLA
jgi:glyoxylase-like metal-dependent hydrolase (beta-lactamase superfamily II)